MDISPCAQQQLASGHVSHTWKLGHLLRMYDALQSVLPHPKAEPVIVFTFM